MTDDQAGKAISNSRLRSRRRTAFGVDLLGNRLQFHDESGGHELFNTDKGRDW